MKINKANLWLRFCLASNFIFGGANPVTTFSYVIGLLIFAYDRPLKITIAYFYPIVFIILLLFHPYTDLKYLFNCTVFYLATVFAWHQLNRSKINVELSIVSTVKLIAAVIILAGFFNLAELSKSFNHLYFAISQSVGIKKELIGVFAIFAFGLIVSSSKPVFYKIILLICVLVFCISIRTVYFSFTLALISVFLRFRGAKVLCVFAFIFIYFFSILTIYYSEYLFAEFYLIIFSDIRGVMLLGVVETLADYPFGIGFGAHDTFFRDILELSPARATEFGVNAKYTLRTDNISTIESDWLMLYTNMGWIGPALIYVPLVYLSIKQHDTRLGIFCVFCTTAYLTAGISQDYVFRIHFFLLILFLLYNSKAPQKG
ncbi:hypothetical protein N9E07_07590 [Planktomarina temperata]|nr:hypothetical protein [Planktomarina temperata]